MTELVPKENILLHMQEDIKRALEKPEAERRWGMVIDLRKCVRSLVSLGLVPTGTVA